MWRSSRLCPTPFSTRSGFLAWRPRQPLNRIEPPWYGPVCPVVWEGRSREAPPYPDLRLCIRKADEAWGEAARGHGLADTRFCRSRTHLGPYDSSATGTSLADRNGLIL